MGAGGGGDDFYVQFEQFKDSSSADEISREYCLFVFIW